MNENENFPQSNTTVAGKAKISDDAISPLQQYSRGDILGGSVPSVQPKLVVKWADDAYYERAERRRTQPGHGLESGRGRGEAHRRINKNGEYMTTPYERTKAMLYALRLLEKMRWTETLPAEFRAEAVHVLRHYPDRAILESLARQSEIGGERSPLGPLLDSDAFRKRT